MGRPLPRGATDELADRVEPDEVVRSVRGALDRAVALFDDERFFEAHEFLEWVWKADEVDESDRDFWKGVTQVAVGCVHIQRGNPAGALTLLGRAADHLAPYPDSHHGIDTRRLEDEARRLLLHLRTQGTESQPDFPRLPVTGA